MYAWETEVTDEGLTINVVKPVVADESYYTSNLFRTKEEAQAAIDIWESWRDMLMPVL